MSTFTSQAYATHINQSHSFDSELLLRRCVCLFPEIEWYVLIPYHVLNFVPTEKGSHEHEVENQQRPEDGEVEILEEGQKCAY